MPSPRDPHTRRRFWLDASFLLVPALTLLAQLARGQFAANLEPTEINALLGITAVCMAAPPLLHRQAQLPGYHSLGHGINVIMTLFGILVLMILLLRVDYSRLSLLTGLGLSLIWSQCYTLLLLRHPVPLALVPGTATDALRKLPACQDWPVLAAPDSEWPTRVHGVAADLQQPLPADWSRAITTMSLRGIPVYDCDEVHESLSGRVSTAHLSANRMGSLTPSPLYLPFKRMTDLVVSASLLLATMPLMAVIVAIIHLDSPGPSLFAQQRVGRNGKPFVLQKFRTMHWAGDEATRHSTHDSDHRITRVGRWLRLFRLDELPQLWQVLRGDMSLIGPRPAVATQDTLNEAKIPFYRHRHIVRPGISGWAQVKQGYVEDENSGDTQHKIEYDFYYIHHLSPWLDVVIMLLTIWTVLSGRGAR